MGFARFECEQRDRLTDLAVIHLRTPANERFCYAQAVIFWEGRKSTLTRDAVLT